MGVGRLPKITRTEPFEVSYSKAKKILSRVPSPCSVRYSHAARTGARSRPNGVPANRGKGPREGVGPLDKIIQSGVGDAGETDFEAGGLVRFNKKGSGAWGGGVGSGGVFEEINLRVQIGVGAVGRIACIKKRLKMLEAPQLQRLAGGSGIIIARELNVTGQIVVGPVAETGVALDGEGATAFGIESFPRVIDDIVVDDIGVAALVALVLAKKKARPLRRRSKSGPATNSPQSADGGSPGCSD